MLQKGNNAVTLALCVDATTGNDGIIKDLTATSCTVYTLQEDEDETRL